MIGEIIGAGASLLGGLINKSSADDNRAVQLQIAAQNAAAQREFAQNGIRWKVDDARAAGVHPVFALGASTNSFSPVTVGDTSSSAMGDAVAQAGQNIGRAAQAAMTMDERKTANTLTALQLEKAGLENDMLRTQIGALRSAQTGPAMPTLGKPGALAGQGDTRNYKLAHEIPISTPKAENQAKDLEDEYGDESIINFINNNYRQFRDLIETGRAHNLPMWGGTTPMSRTLEWLRRPPANPRSRRDRVRWQ